MHDTIETLERILKRIEESQSQDKDLLNDNLLNVVRDDLRNIKNDLLNGQVITEQNHEAVKYTLSCLVQHCKSAIRQYLKNEQIQTTEMTSLNG